MPVPVVWDRVFSNKNDQNNAKNSTKIQIFGTENGAETPI